jgi:hypothetical protein
LSKYDDAKTSDESDDEGQPPYILKSLNYFLSGAELFLKWCGIIRMVGSYFFNIYQMKLLRCVHMETCIKKLQMASNMAGCFTLALAMVLLMASKMAYHLVLNPTRYASTRVLWLASKMARRLVLN